MKQLIRLTIIPLIVILIILAIYTEKYFIFFSIAGIFIITYILTYSSRNARIRYWIQGYKIALKRNGGNQKQAIQLIQQEFCSSKYAIEDICTKEFENIDDLVLEIISMEFKFHDVINISEVASEEETHESLQKYSNIFKKTKKEIEEVKKSVFN